MNVLKLSTLSVACILGLSACGGGGGGGQASPAVTTPTPTPAPSNTTTTNSATGAAGSATANTTTNTNTSNQTKPTTVAQPNTNENNKVPENKPSVFGDGKFISEAKKGMQSMQRYREGYSRGAFDGAMITINNNTGTMTGAPTPNLDFEFFKINGTRVILLQRLDDKLKSIPLRKLTAEDFPDGGYAPKDPANPGYLGSSYGNSQGKGVDSLKSFGQVRFGVYTDNTNTSHLFVHGNPSARSFSGIFRGSAIIGKDGNYRPLPKAVTAYLNQDFTKLDIAIQTDKTTLKFGTDVNYDHKTFSGNDNGVQSYGGLFGTDGLGGFFEVQEGVHKGEHGVFGASNGKDILEDYRE